MLIVQRLSEKLFC